MSLEQPHALACVQVPGYPNPVVVVVQGVMQLLGLKFTQKADHEVMPLTANFIKIHVKDGACVGCTWRPASSWPGRKKKWCQSSLFELFGEMRRG